MIHALKLKKFIDFVNVILFPKLFWPAVRKKCSIDQEKIGIWKPTGKFIFALLREISILLDSKSYSSVCNNCTFSFSIFV